MDHFSLYKCIILKDIFLIDQLDLYNLTIYYFFLHYCYISYKFNKSFIEKCPHLLNDSFYFYLCILKLNI